ncbi:hypothetical protein ZWY2020_030652 [Hordeum vulgare]|nr:hypothetical protein ZWY2020_030652 [Hordeum vulgare]
MELRPFQKAAPPPAARPTAAPIRGRGSERARPSPCPDSARACRRAGPNPRALLVPRFADARRGEMQKSRRDLMKRRAAAKANEQGAGAAAGMRRRRLYFSASLVVASWVALLILNSLVGHGDGQRDGGDPIVAVPIAGPGPTVNEASVSPDVVHQEHEENLAVSGDTCVKLDESVLLSEETVLQEDVCSRMMPKVMALKL